MTVPTGHTVWSGDDWEKHLSALLSMRYMPGDYVPVPSDDHGDLGMDGIGKPDGVVYQCYAPEGEPLAPNVRKKKIKNKITQDLGKLLDKHQEHLDVLGGTVVRKWILLTPIVGSKDLLSHANACALAVQAAGCPYIAKDFQATVLTDELFAAEKKRVVTAIMSKLDVLVPEADVFALEKLQTDKKHSTLIQNLRSKLSKLSTIKNKDRLDDVEKEYLKRYLEGQSALADLQKNHAQIYEAIMKVKRSFERILKMRSDAAHVSADSRLVDELEKFKDALDVHLGANLTPTVISYLVGEAVADWLMRCPLDFLGASDEPNHL